MKAQWISIHIDDQVRALKFNTDSLGFIPKIDVPIGDKFRWPTVGSPEDPEGVEIVLEPDSHPAVVPFTEALVAAGIPMNQFTVDDVQAQPAFDAALKKAAPADHFHWAEASHGVSGDSHSGWQRHHMCLRSL